MKSGSKSKRSFAALYPIGIARMRMWRRRWREPMLTVLLLVQVFILFGLPSLRSAGLPIPHMAVYSVLLAFVAFAIILSRSRVAIMTMIVSVAFTVAGGIWRQEQPDLLTDAISATGQVLTQLSLLWAVSTAVFGPGRTTPHRILGAVVMYLGIGMIFTSLYMLLARTVPAAFTHMPASHTELREALTYFSFSALTTGNFGDIVPVHPIARNLSNLESISGQLFPATLLARIVSLQGAGKEDGNGL